MASDLIAVADLEVIVQSGLPDARLEDYIDAADADIVRYFGPHDGERVYAAVVERGSRAVYLPKPAATISEVKEHLDSVAPASATEVTDYELRHGGRAIRKRAGYWLPNVVVTYTPQADNARRRQVLVDLVKFELARDGLTSSQVGSMRTTNANEGDRNRILGRLRQNYLGGGLGR